ncbi:hypothetical protein M9H77_29843 [Catharanthus roseus]|uniref:Uncharacterized protein n=1 Tax=Catharanthus roseus TaxID=4058 RepID=A0ACB9ZWG4_CATRO|nr:hypothetical protein M9H77_29843 [Catharanthus roseus]
MIGVRYRDSCRLYIQLVTRAAESEKTYDMPKDGMPKMLEIVNAGLKNKQVKIVSVDTVGNARSGSTSTIFPSNIGSANEIRGIKTKEKLTRRSSRRLQSSLEKATKKRKTKGKRSSQNTQEGAYSTYDLNGRNVMSEYFILQPSVSMHSTPFFHFLNQVSYQQNHVPVSSGSMTQICKC